MTRKVLSRNEILEKCWQRKAEFIGTVGTQKGKVYRIGDDLYEQGIENQPEESSALFYHRTLVEARANPYYQHLLEKLQ